MAFEATLLYELERPVPFIAATADTWTKGAILKMTDPMTVAASAGAADIIAGVAATDKVAGVVAASVYRRGIFKFKGSGVIAVGDALVSSSTANHVSHTAAVSQAKIMGISYETTATGDTFVGELLILPQT